MKMTTGISGVQICKKPDRIQDPTAGAAIGALINQVPFCVPVISLKRLKIASRVVLYYNWVICKLTVANIRWTVLYNFNVQCKYLKNKYKDTATNVPKLLPSTTVAKLNDAINVHASEVFGDRK